MFYHVVCGAFPQKVVALNVVCLVGFCKYYLQLKYLRVGIFCVSNLTLSQRRIQAVVDTNSCPRTRSWYCASYIARMRAYRRARTGPIDPMVMGMFSNSRQRRIFEVFCPAHEHIDIYLFLPCAEYPLQVHVKVVLMCVHVDDHVLRSYGAKLQCQ